MGREGGERRLGEKVGREGGERGREHHISKSPVAVRDRRNRSVKENE